MSIVPCAGIGYEIIMSKGLMEWFMFFDSMPPYKEYRQRCILTKKGIMEAAEEIVIVFANILQECGKADSIEGLIFNRSPEVI